VLARLRAIIVCIAAMSAGASAFGFLSPASAVAVQAAAVADMAGAWRLEFAQAGTTSAWQVDCVIDQDDVQDDATLSGACTSGFDALASLRGRLARAHLSFTLEPRQRQAAPDAPPTSWTFDGEVTIERSRAVTMAGTWSVVDDQGKRTSGRFSGRRP
jgi:hypothetical protein